MLLRHELLNRSNGRLTDSDGKLTDSYGGLTDSDGGLTDSDDASERSFEGPPASRPLRA